MLSDVRYALRSLIKAPGFTLVVLATLAIGVGANTAIFSVINAVLLRPAPIAGMDRLALVWETDRNSGTTREPASVPDYLDFKARSRTFEQLAAVMSGEANFAAPNTEPMRLATLAVSHGMLPMLGITPIAGRHFTAEEDRRGGPDLLIISDSLWARLFGRDSAAIGATLLIDDRPHTITGVVADGSDFGVLQILSAAAYSRGFADRGIRTSVDLWMPLRPDPQALPRSTHPIFVVGRLARGSTLAAAQAEMTEIAADLERAHPVNAARGVNVEPLDVVIFGPARPALYLLLVAVGLVLLVACVNVANLFIARNTARAHEYAVRAALGASRARIAWQHLAEALLLSGAAAVGGVALAWAGVRSLVAIAPHDIPRLSQTAIDIPVLVATLGIAIIAGLTFGLTGAIPRRSAQSRTALTDALSRMSAGRGPARARRVLVAAELALAVVLVSGAGLLIRSFWELQRVDAGFSPDGVIKAEYQLPAARYPADFRNWPNFKEQHAFTRALLDKAAALPGVESAAIAGNHPLDPGFTNSFTVIGREAEARNWPELSIRRVTPDYFRTMRVELVRGRLFTEADDVTAPAVGLINAAAARRFFPDRDPIGAQLRFWGTARTIVGVIADEKFHGLAEPSPIAAYTPLAQTPSATGAGVLLVRASGAPAAIVGTLVKAVHEIDPALAVFGVEPLTDTVSRSVSQRRFTMLLLALFAGVALLLAAIGVHGLINYGVVQRRREVGIRLAIGARPSDVLALFLREGITVAVIGTAAGIAGSAILTRLLRTMLFGVGAADTVTLAAVVALLAVVALSAALVPARRAAAIDPAAALRSE